jgi:hypothetical protein
MSVGSVAERLGIRAGTTLWFSPIEWLRLLGPLPAGVTMTAEVAGATNAVLFVSNAASVQWFLRRYRTVITLPPAVWICTPTIGSPDLNPAYFAQILAGHGLRAVEAIPIDASWTAARIGRIVPPAQPAG